MNIFSYLFHTYLFHTFCNTFVLVTLVGLLTPLPSYGKNIPPPTEDEDIDALGQKENQGVNPCDHLPDPPGKAKGLDKKCPQGGSSSGITKGDFNGDGFGDLAIGVPFEDIGNIRDAGGVNVIYGSSNGLIAPPSFNITPSVRVCLGSVPCSQFWSQSSAGVPGSSEQGDRFGAALAAGDFNRDGFSDLAIASPGEDIGSITDRGAVTIIYGSASGLTSTNTSVPAPQFFSLNQIGWNDFLDPSERTNERLGEALAWGDFNGDQVGDLAIGAPGALIPRGNFFKPREAGLVWVLYGVPQQGLSLEQDQVFSEQFFLSGEGSEEGDHFGASLTAGDFNGDGIQELAVGVPGEDITSGSSTIRDAGRVIVFKGAPLGLKFDEVQIWSQFGSAVPGSAEAGDQFGWSLAAGDFDGDTRSDLAIGVPFEDINTSSVNASDGGIVQVIYGSDKGLAVTTQHPVQTWHQNVLFGGVVDPFFGSTTETADAFGFSLAAADFNGDHQADLAVGVPFEDVLSVRSGTVVNLRNAGEVDIIYGSANGLSLTDRAPQSWHQDSINIEGIAQPDDLFGISLTAWNFGKTTSASGEPLADLAIGVPLEDTPNPDDPAQEGLVFSDGGAVAVLYSNSGGLSSFGDQLWTQGSPNVPDSPETGDQFGRALY